MHWKHVNIHRLNPCLPCWDRTGFGRAGQCVAGHCRCDSVSLCPAINRCHLTVQSTRGRAEQPAGYQGRLLLSTEAANRISDQWQRQKGKAQKVSKKWGWDRRRVRDRDEGRGEVWQDKGSYASEGQFLALDWMTNRLSAARKWKYSFWCCTTENMAPCTCMHINVHRHSHSSLIENAAGEFSVSHCFMNSIYKVFAVCATLLVVSSACAALKVMTGCE